MTKCRKLIFKLSKMNFLLFVGMFFVVLTLLNFLISGFVPESAFQIPEQIDLSRFWMGKILAVVAAPLVESILFQMTPILIIKTLISKEKYAFWLSIFVSALAFALAHGMNYNEHYGIAAFGAGLVLATAYNLASYRKETPVLSVFMIHALNNLLALCFIESQVY